MPIDASIPLGFKQPDPTQQLSGMLNIANSAQQVQNNSISLNERKAMQSVLSDPANYSDPDGSFNLTKAQGAIMRAAPTTGSKYITDLATAHGQALAATRSLNSLSAENRAQLGSVLAAIPPGSPPELVGKTVDAIRNQFKGIDPAADVFMSGYKQALAQGPKAADEFIMRSARGVLPQETQQAMNTPSGVTVTNNQQTQLTNLKPGVQGIPQGAAAPGTQVQNLIPPGAQEETITDAFGNRFVQTKDVNGRIVGTRPLGSAAPGQQGPISFPAGESKETFDALNQERSAARQTALAAPQMHDINRTIISEAGKGLNTGTLGALTQRVASATGFHLDPNDKSTDYNILGKMLERSALTAAQSMGPHTNAGLEAAVRANGSLDYTPQAIKKIAYLNDALVSGSELYSRGLENAIGKSPNSVFAKRDFDRQWGQVATPQALRLKNAVDGGNKEEIETIVREVGGKGTKGAQALHSQLRKLIELTGQ